MLLAVEGGGFFSASASGYSKGLALLLLAQKNKETPMRVSPWNQYQLVEQDSDPDLLLASVKNQLTRRCASCVCFRRSSAGIDGPFPLTVDPGHQQDALQRPLVSETGKDDIVDLVDSNNARRVALKSSLKKPSNSVAVPFQDANELEASSRNGGGIPPGHMEKRKVQWTDECGNDLVEIREFEPSESGGSDDEFDSRNEGRCLCSIM